MTHATGRDRYARREVRPFSDKQIALLQNFAAQAVIAMENARLLTETREALEQQTATAEVLQVINSSPGDLAPVFDAILEKAHSLCGAALGSLGIFDGETWRAVAQRGYGEPLASILRQPARGSDNPLLQELIDGAPLVHVADLAQLDHPDSASRTSQPASAPCWCVALRKDDALLGTFPSPDERSGRSPTSRSRCCRTSRRRRSSRWRTRGSLTETREALEQQTATAEVLQVINSSPGDLAPVFDAMLEKATRLCEAAFGIMQTYDGEAFRTMAHHNSPAQFAEFLRHAVAPDARNGQ